MQMVKVLSDLVNPWQSGIMSSSWLEWVSYRWVDQYQNLICLIDSHWSRWSWFLCMFRNCRQPGKHVNSGDLLVYMKSWQHVFSLCSCAASALRLSDNKEKCMQLFTVCTFNTLHLMNFTLSLFALSVCYFYSVFSSHPCSLIDVYVSVWHAFRGKGFVVIGWWQYRTRDSISLLVSDIQRT